FTVGGRRVETRLLVRHADGGWAGYPYVWNEAGTDAVLARAGAEVDGWSVPSTPQCLQCHVVAPTGSPLGGTLGLSVQQLDVDYVFDSGWTENQLDLWVRLGWLATAPARPGPYPALDDASAPLDVRARTYLEVNCAICHVEGGPGGGSLDLRASVSLADTAACDPPEVTDLGVAGARVITPGDPARALRMHRRDSAGMPPIASDTVDTAGAALIDAWITALTACP
ncbi:MAG: hypothetical protein ABMB14_41010, partial [Myxococcota bacterium]